MEPASIQDLPSKLSRVFSFVICLLPLQRELSSSVDISYLPTRLHSIPTLSEG